MRVIRNDARNLFLNYPVDTRARGLSNRTDCRHSQLLGESERSASLTASPVPFSYGVPRVCARARTIRAVPRKSSIFKVDSKVVRKSSPRGVKSPGRILHFTIYLGRSWSSRPSFRDARPVNRLGEKARPVTDLISRVLACEVTYDS